VFTDRPWEVLGSVLPICSSRQLSISRSSVARSFSELRRYQGRLSAETLMINEIYLTMLFRPITGAAPTPVSRLLSKRAVTSVCTERASTR
ncbi:MAG: hypothetical protein ACRETD_15220, partial [Steroidobacteraceae bacterium]